jgi:hypothetical protein
LEVSGQLYAPAALPPGKEPPVPIGYEVEICWYGSKFYFLYTYTQFAAYGFHEQGPLKPDLNTTELTCRRLETTEQDISQPNMKFIYSMFCTLFYS